MTEAPVVAVEQGQLQGKVVTSATGKAYYSFQGIPYAKPPLGSLRFQAPHPPEPWEGVRDATSEGNISAQIDPNFGRGFEGDENCLFLNVYTTNLDGSFLPVMVYIHGGGFRYGSGNASLYGADFLVEKDVVVVTLNYRCGPLGFLCLNTPEVPGNAGVKDVVQAIRWIKENIQNFGGNPGNITLFGESAGGAMVSALTASPLTKSLINKAIIQSGVALCPWVFQKNPIENAKLLAKELGCESEDVDEILEILRATPVKDIIEACENLGPSIHFDDKGEGIFVLVVEKEFPLIESVISEPFTSVLTSGRVADVPVMIGATALEFVFEPKGDDLQKFIPDELHIERDSAQSLGIAEKIKELYLKGRNPTSLENLEDYFRLVSDGLINIGTHRYINYLVQVTNRPIYLYRFDYVGDLNVSRKLMKSSSGSDYARHTDELGYMFANEFQKDLELTPQDLKMRERVVRLWTNFAKTGNPTPEESHYLPLTWAPVTKDAQNCMLLGAELSLTTNPDQDKMAFWDDLYSKYYRIWEQTESNTVDAPRKPNVVETVIETVVITSQVVTQDGQEVRVTEELITLAPELPSTEPPKVIEEQIQIIEPVIVPEPVAITPEPVETAPEPVKTYPEPVKTAPEVVKEASHLNGSMERKVRPSNEIKMVQNSNGAPKDVIRANDPPEDDLPKNIGVNKFVNFFESLGGKK